MLWLDRQLATTDILKFKVESDQRNANLYISRIEKNESIVRSKFDDELVLQVWSYEMMLLSFIDFDFFLFFFFFPLSQEMWFRYLILCEKKKWCFFLFWNFLTVLIEPCDPS
jgi:hypothetical protein